MLIYGDERDDEPPTWWDTFFTYVYIVLAASLMMAGILQLAGATMVRGYGVILIVISIYLIWKP